MSLTKIVRCDACGKTDERYTPHGWYKVEHSQMPTSISPRRLDFCSDQCVIDGLGKSETVLLLDTSNANVTALHA